MEPMYNKPRNHFAKSPSPKHQIPLSHFAQFVNSFYQIVIKNIYKTK